MSHKDGSKPEDLTFGVKFNPEDHLSVLHSEVAKEKNELSEEELEEKVEEEDKLLNKLPKRNKGKVKDPMFVWWLRDIPTLFPTPSTNRYVAYQ